MLKQTIGHFTGNPSDLVDMVDMCVKTDLLGHISAFVRKFDERIGPRVSFISDTARSHSESFRRETDTLDVRNAKQSVESQGLTYCTSLINKPFANFLKVIRLQVVGVTTRDDNIMKA